MTFGVAPCIAKRLSIDNEVTEIKCPILSSNSEPLGDLSFAVSIFEFSVLFPKTFEFIDLASGTQNNQTFQIFFLRCEI